MREKYESVSFVVSGEAKSAGTLMVLSGDTIIMTKTGSVGPIDAQIKLGRSTVSAYDYMEWVENTRKRAEKDGELNPFDAVMVSQITPGELGDVFHALKFAEDLVIRWLSAYKFKNWVKTETKKKKVTTQMKKARAKVIAEKLNDHSLWRSHARSIKIRDLNDIGLKIDLADEDSNLSDLIYRIQVICSLLFSSTQIYKLFVTQDKKIFKTATPIQLSPRETEPLKLAEVAEFQSACEKCGKIRKIYAKFSENKKIDADFKKQGAISFPKDGKIVCDCGFEIDLTGIKNELELKSGKKIVY